MKINSLSQDLVGLLDQYTYLRNPQEEVFTYQLYHPHVEMAENVLYIFAEKSIRIASPSDLSLNLLLQVSDRSPDLPAIRAKYPNSNLIFCKCAGDVFSLFDMVSASFLTESRSGNYFNQLLNIYRKNQGLQPLVDAFYAIIRSPVVIMDIGYKILCMHSEKSDGDIYDLEKQKEAGFMTDDNVQRMKNDQTFEKLRRSPDGYIYSKPTGTDYYWYDTLVYLHGIEVAEIGVLEIDHKFTRYDFELIGFFRTLVTWEMARGDFFVPSKGLMHNLFLSELLNQTFVSDEVTEKRRTMLGWPDCRSYRVLTVFGDNRKNFNSRAEILVTHFKSIVTNSHWLITDTDIMFLILEPLDPEGMQFPRDQIESLLSRYQLQAIMSNSFGNLKNLRKYYNQTKDVLEFLKYDEHVGFLHEYQDLALCHMAKLISETHDLNDFYHPAIPLIRKYDLAKHTEYLKTLGEYLRHSEDPALCADRLAVHKNTFFYRMTRIRELFDLDLTDGLVRARLLITIEFMKISET